MSLHGWIIYNGHLPATKFLDFAEWLQLSASNKNITTQIIKNNELLSVLSSDSLDIVQEIIIDLPDFVIFTDKDIYLAKQLELLGVRVFNSAQSIAVSDDKIATYQILAQHRLPIPKTIISPKIFSNLNQIDIGFSDKIVKILGFPMIIKEAYGSFGEQVYIVKTVDEMTKKVRELAGKPFIFQEFIDSSYGKDIRLHVVGNQVVASMLRTASNDFRANVSAGGTMEPYFPSSFERETAIAATKAIGADFAGVDLLFGPNQTPIICEINSNAHIRNMYDCTNINVADYIIDYITDWFEHK
ncbi:RimK family alpha-L-glutamate ligase [Virgibacillus byunsanensis]|uniref:RimK family alpha-L-glutamate ligase n=1 Tax=Virgibacillus byunsanensis TaxID=570945 RepID=A0ABW3LNL5_9BACI